MDYLTLNNGLQMPMVGYGVYKIEDKEECIACVLDALDVGYRMIDTAQLYLNEEYVGEALRRTDVPLDEIFVSTKVWVTNAGYDAAMASVLESKRKLGLEVIDCVMIHQAFGDYYGTYRALEDLYEQGVIRSVGLSNFYPERLVDLIYYNKVVPVINQIEAHVFTQRLDEKELMDQYGVVMQAWSPLARGQNNLFHHEVLSAIGAKYGKSAAQIALKYLVQMGISIVPKTTKKERMIENFDLFDFMLSEDELLEIKALDGSHRITDHNTVAAAEAIFAKRI